MSYLCTTRECKTRVDTSDTVGLDFLVNIDRNHGSVALSTENSPGVLGQAPTVIKPAPLFICCPFPATTVLTIRAENTNFPFTCGCFPAFELHRLIDQQPGAESIPRETAARRREEAG